MLGLVKVPEPSRPPPSQEPGNSESSQRPNLLLVDSSGFRLQRPSTVLSHRLTLARFPMWEVLGCTLESTTLDPQTFSKRLISHKKRMVLGLGPNTSLAPRDPQW